MIEVNLLKNLNNPYIVKFEQYFHEEDFLIIVLEYCDNRDLKYLIEKNIE
jgi:serine/threonine protein kinase